MGHLLDLDLYGADPQARQPADVCLTAPALKRLHQASALEPYASGTIGRPEPPPGRCHAACRQIENRAIMA